MQSRDTYLPKSELEHGAYYHGRCRNATTARWDAERNCFRHWRTKFAYTFLEEIKHPEDDQVYDVFKPAKKIEPTVPEIPLDIPTRIEDLKG